MSSTTLPSAPVDQSESQQNVNILTDQATPIDTDGIGLPADAGGLAIGILATAAVLFTLESAQGLLISLILGVIFAYTLNPVVVWLEKIRIPRVLGAAIVVIAVLSITILGTYALRGQVQGILTQLPAAVSKLSTGLASMQREQRTNMKNVQAAATAIEEVTNPVSKEPLAKQVVVVEPTFEINNFLWVGSKGILQIIGQVSMVLFLVYFLLLAANTFKRKLVRITGPPLSRKKITVLILDDINSSIQRYMLMLLLTNVLVGLLAWLAFRWIGLENAGAWAVAAGLLHIIPYFGPGIVSVAVGVAAYMQAESLSLVLLAIGSMLAISTVVGIFITTWMTGRIAKMNTAAVFISLLFWSWLWGLWGMLLSMPIIVIVKVISQHVPRLRIVAALLSEYNMTTETQETRDRLVEDFKTVIQDMEELIKATASQTGDKVAAVRARAEENLNEARRKLDDMGGDVLARGKAAAQATDDLVREKPWQSVAFATAVGVMLGMLISRR